MDNANTDFKLIARNIVFLGALGFFIYYIRDNFHEVRATLTQLNTLQIVLACVFVSLSLLMKAFMNLVFIRALLHTDLPSWKILHSYTQSQIVKYIPGKIWSIVFQASALAKNVNKGDVWIVNIYSMIVYNASTLAIVLAAFLFLEIIPATLKWQVLLAVLAIGALFYFKWVDFLKLINVDVEKFRKYAVFLDKKIIIKLIYIVALDWIFYFGLWFCLCTHQMSLFKTFVMAINYAASSVFGIIVFILPNGLIAREAAFIAIGRFLGESTSFLLVYSLVARFLYIVGDITLYFVMLFYNQFTRRVYD